MSNRAMHSQPRAGMLSRGVHEAHRCLSKDVLGDLFPRKCQRANPTNTSINNQQFAVTLWQHLLVHEEQIMSCDWRTI